jgi:hypothetical protein
MDRGLDDALGVAYSLFTGFRHFTLARLSRLLGSRGVHVAWTGCSTSPSAPPTPRSPALDFLASATYAGPSLCSPRHGCCVTSLGLPPQPQDPGAPQRTLSEVRAASSTHGVGNHVQPYQKDRVSWAPAGFVPVPIGPALCEPDREWFGKWATHLLVLPAEAAAAAAVSGLERPHMDPQLSHIANTYA